MNGCKKTTNSWILCPSKSIPGKFYYFNVVTGEAVWGLDDIQTNAPKKDYNIQKVADKSHTYPEPQIHNTSEEFSNTSNVYSNIGNLYQQTPSTYPRYGQAVFPQYFSNGTPSLVPSIIWTPIQIPMLMTNEKRMSDRNTQTADIVSNLAIQTCKMPLSKRFALLGNSMKLDISGSTNSIATSSLMCTENWRNKQSLLNEKGLLKDQVQRNLKKFDHSNLIRAPKLNYQTSALENTVSNKHIEPCKVNDFEYNMDYDEENDNTEDGLLKKLDKNDLRYLLVSKRRKCVDLGIVNNDKKSEENKISNSHTVSPEKKVTFSQNTSDNGSIISISDSDDTPKQPIPIKLLRDLGKIDDPNTHWYIVVDRDILLDDMDFIMKYVEGDEFCKLLVPISILKNIESLGIGDGKYPMVLNARQIYRRLINTSNKVQTVDIKETASMHDDVLSCCLQAINGNLHVVLITKYAEVYEKAQHLDIHTYFVNDIKTENPKSKSPTFDFQPITVTVKNKNLFQQRDGCEQFVINKSDNLSNVIDNIRNDKNYDNNNDNTEDMLAINKNILELDLNSPKGIKRGIKNDKNHNKKIDIGNKKCIYNNEKSTGENNYCSSEVNETQTFKPLVFQKVFFNSQNGLKNENKTTDNKDQRDSLNKDVNKNDLITPKTIIKNKENGGFYDWKSIVLTIDNESSNRIATDNKCQVEDKIKRFYIKDKVTEQNIIARMDEYSCCYIQIMEEFLNIVLKKNMFVQKCLPCSFLEGLEYLKEFYFDVKIKNIIKELMSLWKKEDNIKMDVKPGDFIRVIERGWLLVDSLKNNIPDDIEEIEYMFIKLTESMENPIIEDVELIQTPVRRSQDQVLRSNYIKDESEIVEYLKKNFVEWKDYEIKKPDNHFKNVGYNDDVHIIRTSGKHLNRFKIDNKKQITLNSNSDDENNKNHEKPQTNGLSDLNIPVLHENTLEINNKDGPKVIRNVNRIDEFENKMDIINNELNYNNRYSEIVDTITSRIDNNISYNNNYINLNNNDSLGNDKFGNDYQNNDCSFNETNNNDTVDSGFENESLYTCTFIRNFLMDLSSSFKLIYTFIDKCHNEFRGGVMEETEKKSLYEKAKQTHEEMGAIIDKLKSIIERESAEGTELKLLLIKAGLDVSEDKRIARYRQTVTKCLEQAQILNCCLKLILSTNKDDVIDNISLNSYNLLSYFNIFE